jgi:hypothetical protein
VTANATWAARREYTSVIDAAGHIYVLGGALYEDDAPFYHDVWRSDQGERHAVCDA